eukprot:gene8341-biopygen4623
MDCICYATHGIMSDLVQEWHPEEVERRVLRGAIQKTQGIIKNAGNHAGYRPGMACPNVIFEAFWSILQAFWPPKLAKSCFKHAPQRRGYTRSLPMGPIDDAFFCMIFLEKKPGVWYTVSPSAAKKIMPDTIQEWHAEDVIFEAFLEHFGDKNHKIASKHAPQRRDYACSVQKCPIDDRAHARKMRFFERLVSESRQGFSSLSLHAMI